MARKTSGLNSLYGFPSPISKSNAAPIVQPRNPTIYDQADVIGQTWVNSVAQTAFTNVGTTGGQSIWVVAPSGGTATTSLIINPGNLELTNGNILVDVGTLTVAGDTSLQALQVGQITGVAGMTLTDNLVVDGDLTVMGTATYEGVVDILTADAVHITSTDNAAGAISLITAGGTNETILIQSQQGDGNGAITLSSEVGGVTIAGDTGVEIGSTAGPVSLLGNGGTNQDIVLSTPAGGGGIEVTTNTGGFNVVAAGGPISLASGTGQIDISSDAAVTTVNLGIGAAVKTIAIGGTAANVITLGNTQTAGSIAIGTAMTTGTISIGGTGLQVGAFSLAPGTGAQTVSIANGAGVKTIQIGNGVSGNAITIANGVNTAAQTVVISGGASGANSTVSILSGNVSAGVSTLNLATGTGGKTVHIADSAGLNVVTLGSTNTTSSTTINAGTGGISFVSGGRITVGTATATVASPTATATISNNVGQATFTGFTTAAAATQVFTITNALVVATSAILVTAANLGGNDATMTVTRVTPGAGTFNVTLQNLGSAALNGNVMISFWVLNA